MTWSTREDEWWWNLEESGFFPVKSAYERVLDVVVTEELLGVEEKRVFRNLWKSPAPSKVLALAWKVLLNRVPTKVNLAVRNVINPEESTLHVMCNGAEESSIHLFLHCDVAVLVWSKLMLWLNCHFLTPPNLFVHWECWSRRCGNKNRFRGRWLIWNTTIWVLRKARNDKIFKDINYEVDDIVEEIKVLS